MEESVVVEDLSRVVETKVVGEAPMKKIKRNQKEVVLFFWELRRMFGAQEFCDLLIRGKDGDVSCPSVLLSTVSPFLRHLFSQRVLPEHEQQLLLLLPDCSVADLQTFIAGLLTLGQDQPEFDFCDSDAFRVVADLLETFAPLKQQYEELEDARRERILAKTLATNGLPPPAATWCQVSIKAETGETGTSANDVKDKEFYQEQRIVVEDDIKNFIDDRESSSGSGDDDSGDDYLDPGSENNSDDEEYRPSKKELPPSSSWKKDECLGTNLNFTGGKRRPGRPRKSEMRELNAEHEKLIETVEDPQGDITYKCKECGIVFDKKWSMNVHIRVHTGDRPYVCEVAECGANFARPQNLWRHHKTHSQEKPHSCPICAKAFCERKDMMSHIVVHDEARKTQNRFLPQDMWHLLETETTFEFDGREVRTDSICEVCGKIFEQPTMKKRHVSQVHEGEKPFKCDRPDCTRNFTSKAGLERHLNDHTGEFPFLCQECPKKFKSSTELNQHSVRHMDPEDVGANRKCPHEGCDKVFEKKFYLDIHIRRHHTHEKPFECETCGKTFTVKAALKDHERVHTGEKPYECDKCKKAFTTSGALRIHKMIHDEQKRFNCDVENCDQSFKINKNLWKHKKADHGIVSEKGEGKVVDCPKCDKRCSDKHALEKHMIKHTVEKNFVCNICGKRLKRQSSLDLHLRQHTGTKNYMCDACDATYFTASALRNHKVNKHMEVKETFLCTFCGKGFTKKANLESHITLHTGEKRYSCTQCDKKFRSHSVYQNHLRYHKGKKEFVCTYCGKAFMQKSHLQRHTATHTGERNHVCPVCQKTFIEPGDVRKHMRTHSKESINFHTGGSLTRGTQQVTPRLDEEDEEREEKPQPADHWPPHHQLAPPQRLGGGERLELRMTVQGGGGPPNPPATPTHMLCGLCGLLCKRATRIACCNAQCCWGCGIRYVTKSRKCWACPSIVATTKELLQHSDLREEIRLHSLHVTKELVAQASNKEELEKALDEYLRLKENNGKEEEEMERKSKERDGKPIEEERKETCDNRELTSGRRTSPRKKKALELGPQSIEQSLNVADLSTENQSLPENQDSFENHESDPELPPPVPVLPPVIPVTSTNLTDASKVDPLTGENDATIGSEEVNTVKEANIVKKATLTDTPEGQNSEAQAPASDLFAVGQNAEKSGGRKKLNRISVDRLEVPPTPPRRSSRRRPPSESPSRVPPPSSARSLSPNKSPSKRKARGKSRRFEDEEEEEDDEPSALHPAQLPLPIEESPPLASDKFSLPVPLQATPSEAQQQPEEESAKCEKATRLKISLASGFSALAEKIGPRPAVLHHLDDLEPYVESEKEKQERERKRIEDKQFLEEEKRRLEEEKKILEKKVLEKKKKEEEKEAKKQENEQAEIAPTRKGAADFFDIIMKETSEELREADTETAVGGYAKADTRIVKIVDGDVNAEEVGGGGEKVQVTEQRRIKRISLDKEEEVELKCVLCTPETKCSVCELQKPPSRPSSRAEKVLRQERWRRERSGEREQESRQMRREERSAKRREKRQRSSEKSSSYLSDLMKEGRMRCDEEGSSGKVTRMDGRIRIQDKVAVDKRKDNKILGIVTIDRDSEETMKGRDERSSVREEGFQMDTKSEKEDKVKFTVKESKKLRSHTPEQEEYLLKLSKEEEEEDKQCQQRPTSALGAVVKNDVKEPDEDVSHESKESKRDEKKRAKREKKERKKEKKLEKKNRDSRERDSKEEYSEQDRESSEEKESSRKKEKHSKRSHFKEEHYSRDRDSSEEEKSARKEDKHNSKDRLYSREKEHSQERDRSRERNKSRRKRSEEKRGHSRGREYSEERKLDRSPRKSPRGDRLSRIEADLKRGALSEWDLKRVTGGFESKKWSWEKKKEDEMKAFLKYENLCNREKKSIAAKFAERDRLWMEEKEKEREERRKEKASRERTHSGGEKSKRERSFSRGEEKSKHREGSGKRSESSKYMEDKDEKEERTVRRTDEESRAHKKRDEEEKRERKLSKREEDEEVYGPKAPPASRKSEERSHASRKTDSRSRPRKKSEERISKSGHNRSSSSKGIKEKEHSSRKDERYIQKQEDKRTEEDVNAEKTENTQDDPAPILNALQMLQFGLKLNRKAETAVPEEPENSVETPIKDKKAKKKEKKEKEKKAKDDKKEREKLMELFEDEKKLLEMFESPKKSKSKSKEPPKEKERRSETEKDEDVDESKVKFKLKDSKKLRSLTPEQEEYLLKLSKEVDEERKKKEEEEERQKKEKEEEEKRAEEERKKEEEDVKGQIVHRQLVKTAECQEHERIIRRIEDAPKQGKEEETEPEEGEVCSSAMQSDEEREEEDELQERLEAVADAKSKLDLIRSELERVKEKVSSSKKKKGKKLKKKEKADHDEMKRLEKEVEEMAQEVKDIEEETSKAEDEKSKKRAKKKRKRRESEREKGEGMDKINIEVDARLGKKILSMFVSKDMFQDVLKKEAKNTESTIQNIKKVLELKHQQEERSRKKRKKKKQKLEEEDIVQEKKRLRSLDSKLAKYASLMSEVLKSPSPIPGPSTQTDPQPGPSRDPTKPSNSDTTLKRKPRDVSSEPEGPPKKKKKKSSRSRDASPGDSSTTLDTSLDTAEAREQRTVRVVADVSDDDDVDYTSNRKMKKKDKKEARKKHKKEKRQKRKENEKANKDELSEDENSHIEEEVKEKKVKEVEDKDTEEDLDILDLNIGEEDIDILDEENSNQNDTRAPLKPKKRTNSESKVTTTTAMSSFEKEEVEGKKDEFKDDPERRLQAAVLAQARKLRFAQTEERVREVSSPSVSSTTTSASNYPNLPLPRYAYSYSRTFITPEQKAEHFPNLFNRFLVPLDTSDDDSTDSECEEGFCEGMGRLVTELPLVLLLRSLRMSRQGSPR